MEVNFQKKKRGGKEFKVEEVVGGKNSMVVLERVLQGDVLDNVGDERMVVTGT